MDRTIQKEEYRFDEKKHLHQLLDGETWKALTGVTTVLSVIAKPALIQWSANEAVKYILEHSETNRLTDNKIETWVNVLEEAKTAHRKKKETAGEQGTDVHAEVEAIIKWAMTENGGLVSVSTPAFSEEEDADKIVHVLFKGKPVSEQTEHFLKWAMDNQAKFVGSEEHVYSKEYWIGGICDFLCEIGGELWVGDIKTSSAIYPEHFFQTAAYQMCLEEMGLHKNFKGHIIVNLKKDGTFAEKRSISNGDNLSAFLAALTLYRVQEKLKGTL